MTSWSWHERRHVWQDHDDSEPTSTTVQAATHSQGEPSGMGHKSRNVQWSCQESRVYVCHAYCYILLHTTVMYIVSPKRGKWIVTSFVGLYFSIFLGVAICNFGCFLQNAKTSKSNRIYYIHMYADLPISVCSPCSNGVFDWWQFCESCERWLELSKYQFLVYP